MPLRALRNLQASPKPHRVAKLQTSQSDDQTTILVINCTQGRITGLKDASDCSELSVQFTFETVKNNTVE